MFHRRRVLAAACAAVALRSASAALATTGTVTVSGTQSGATPAHVGFNMGHYMPGSTTSAWVEFSGANGFRVWASPGDYEPSGNWGTGVNNLADFDARKAAVSANPEGNSYINWGSADVVADSYNYHFENSTQNGRNKVRLNYILSELTSRDVDVVLQVSRALPKGQTGATWSDNWEQWQHFYAMGYHAAKNYDVQRYQMYNEPDQSSVSAQRTPEEWMASMKLASDAIRTAIADVNRDFGKSLTAHVAGPTKINGTNSTTTWTPGAGYADYGEAILENNRTDYAGRSVNYDVMNVYDLHRYNDTSAGGAYATDLQNLKTLIPQYNVSGQMLPVTYTEYNRRNSSSYAGSTDTPDTPQMFAEFASINLRAMSEGVSGMYAFKFNQTLWDHDSSSATPDQPQKTGLFFVKDGGTYDTTGATKSAGVQRLFAKGFKGERPRLTTGGTSVSTYDVASSYDAGSGNYYLMGVNRHSSEAHDLTLDLTGWDVQPGTVLSIEEVSSAHNGAVTRMITVPQNKIIALNGQPSRSVWLVTAPKGTPQAQLVLNPTDDARVRNSDGASGEDYSANNYGALSRAYVGRTPGTGDGSARLDYVSYLQFSTVGIQADVVSRAILQLTGRSTDLDGGNPGLIQFHVYALTGDNWDESAITWDNAPNLDDLDAKVTGVGSNAFPVGMLTFGSTQSEWGIDLTEFLRLHPEVFEDGAISFALVREERFTDDADATESFVELWTKESGLATAPKLTLTVVPDPGALAILGGAGLTLLLRRRTGLRRKPFSNTELCHPEVLRGISE